MVSWRVVFTAQAQRDAKKVAGSGLKEQVEKLLKILGRDPLQTPPRFERLVGDLRGAYSRRINIQHRLVYEVVEEERAEKAALGCGWRKRDRTASS